MKIKLLALIILLVLLSGCGGHNYTLKYLAYPPEIAPHEDGWSYLCQVTTLAEHYGPVSQRGPKKIEILIKDKNDKIFLEDQLQVVSASIDPQISWSRFENIQILILEKGNQYSQDEYNLSLIKNGTRLIETLDYDLDEKTKLFVKRQGRTN
jgi:hypothetical protein